MKRITSLSLASIFLLLVASMAFAQQSPQPVVRMGNRIEVGNDVWMHILASADIRYRTVQNLDFESRIRDRTDSRGPTDTPNHDSEGELSYAELRLGAEFWYQKSLFVHLLFEHQQVFDGNLIDDRSNTTNPGGTDIFGRTAQTENPGFHVERYWIDYSFPGTPIRMRVGADLWTQDQAGLLGDDDPRFAVFAKFGGLELSAAAVMQNESQRLGLQNDNDFVYYTFGASYNAKPHKVALDIAYFRDRFNGADTGSATGAVAFRGQKTDSVLIMPSWSGNVGPLRGLLQGNVLLGTSRGGTGVGLPRGAIASRDYDIAAFAGVAYAELDLGVVRPFVGAIFGTGDGDPTDDKLHGFMTLPQREITLLTGTSFFAHLDTSQALQLRDYSCPARAQGLRTAPRAADPATAVGATVLGSGGGIAGTQCSHTTGNPFNDRMGNTSHLGLNSTYSNPGVLVIPAGLRVFPVKGHDLVAWYVYRQMLKTALVEIAFAPELAGRSIGKTQYHEVGGSWQWTLNPHFDIRLSGNLAIPGGGYKDLARLVDCDPQVAGLQACAGNDIALTGEARFRARF